MSVRRAALWVMSTQYLSFAIQFATSIYLARTYILPDALGLFSIAFAAAALLAVLQDFGLNRYVVGAPDLNDRLIRTAFSVSTVIALSVATVILLLAAPVSWAYQKPALLPLLLVIGCSYLLVPLATIPVALRQRAMDFRSNAMIEVGAASANAVVSILLAARGHGALALAWGVFAQQAARVAIAQYCNGFILPWPLNFSGATPMMRFGGGNSVLTISGGLSQRAPDLIIGSILSAASVGLFARAVGLAAQLRMLVSGAVASVFYPAFARVRDAGEPLGPPYVRVVAAYCVVTWPATAALAVAAEPLVQLLYGPQWLGAVPLVKWIALSQMCFVALPLHVELPLLLGRMRSLIGYNIVDTTVSIGLLAATAFLGIEWVAASRLAYGLIWLLIYARFLHGMIGFQWGALIDVYIRSMIATVAALLPMLLAYAFWRAPLELGFDGLLICTAAGIACWLVTLFVIRHPTGEEIVSILSDILRGVRRCFG